ncbi:NAD(P)/FAD-dependent oxidoreductase [Yinghuangia soli]|uniref:NAD(P)/FAD-dependent oxidoreductase n=1 Tax=Yinghuangia soli TaxID=2908204 RepID=A0AA41PY32_9ACTN|nr:NAD(P)/FAD-dependent oxidoreductase [Yinghuangia soli]MCF2527965.1 NAD(P)/FAD-dependent oxidoreductase [Yinghuangia soli]
MAYDVIIVGGRVAGSATAMLLARRGLRVLVLERAGLPSDTVSSHQIQVPGVALLRDWGLLDRLRAAGTPPTRHVRFIAEDTVLAGDFPEFRGVDTLYSPRRTVLDAMLADAAREAGAEVREHVRVEELLWRDGRVVGVRARGRGGAAVDETARYVVGADGKHSFVAQAVRARAYRERPPRAFACYGYWSGLPMEHGELYQQRGRAVAVFPTNDDLTMVYMSAPMAEFEEFRGGIERGYLATAARCGDLGERLAGATRAERLRTTPDQPNRFRVPYGPGWALVGDAGVVMDSVTAQGITNAFTDAARLSGALADCLGAGGTFVPESASESPAEARPAGEGPRGVLAAYHRDRDRALGGMYDLTLRLARHQPGIAERLLLAAVARRPGEVSRLLGAFAGAEAPERYFGPATLVRLLTGYPCDRRAAVSGRREGLGWG